MEGKLQKPTFVKVSSLENSRDGYNVYVKVVSAENSTSANQTFDMVRAVVADETGSANAFFKGDNAKLIKKDAVIAIRNGKIRLVKGHISLEVDIFGRITEQKVEIKANTTVNISDKEITRRPRNNRPRREDDGERRPRRDDGERRPRREDDGERKPRRDYDGERKPRREDDGERKPRRDYDSERKPRREDDGERKPRRDYDGERRPRREDGTDRPKMEWTKIGAIEPGEDGLNITAKVISVEQVKNKMRVVFGDETGKVKGFVFANDALKEGNTVVIFRAEAAVVKEHIELQVPKGGRIQESKNKKITDVDEGVDISAKAWVESA